jgi:hypothetical protein
MIPDNVVACMKVMSNQPPLIKGARKEKCCNCENQVWVSPATRMSIKEGLYPDVFACLECIRKRVKK